MIVTEHIDRLLDKLWFIFYFLMNDLWQHVINKTKVYSDASRYGSELRHSGASKMNANTSMLTCSQ